MKETLITFLGSMLKTFAASVAIGGIAYVLGQSFIIWASAGFVGQYIIFYLYNSYLMYRAARVIKENQLKELEILARVTFDINCAGCKQTNQVVIVPYDDNQFECVHCGAKNSAYITAEAALVTVPIATDTQITVPTEKA